ncbi:hypothetical protein OM076_35900 [Solirubrobacter ginsenosidimutans]|uniref:Uncharacterized protein n=1 Tax=Solirubrobacter ginsenosidimutans TaxID=490573 RepID=A0A9X3S5J9_9ACTN|nr:hypothetical protein [Solirubrobacter ginsenosidimutans]MDA0165707.1 hypothetical protein [Solirubrobacter ginsenosidimutans]
MPSRSEIRDHNTSTSPAHASRSPTEPTAPKYIARVALSCGHGHPPGQVLHALQQLQPVIDDRLRRDLGDRHQRHATESSGADKLTVTLELQAPSHADAIRAAGIALGMLADLIADVAGVDLAGVALVVRAR